MDSFEFEGDSRTEVKELVELAITTVRELATSGQHFSYFAFMLNTIKKESHSEAHSYHCNEGKTAGEMALRKMAEIMEADVYVGAIKGFALPMNSDYQAVIAKYGSISNCPDRKRIISFVLETELGTWAATADVKQDKNDSDKFKFGDIKFEKVTPGDGKFLNFLKKPAGTFH